MNFNSVLWFTVGVIVGYSVWQREFNERTYWLRQFRVV